MTAILGFLILHWYLSLFFQTFFHHRYAAHKMFTMSPAWEKVFFILSFIFQGSSYIGVYAYGVMHRMHHAYADTEKDPHSPKFSDNLFHMMWKTKKVYSDVFRGTMQVEERFVKDVPQWQKFEIMANSAVVRIAWGLLYIGIYSVLATEWWMYLFLPIHFVMGPLHGAIINWFAHRIGYRNFEVSDTSRNILPFDFLMLGEGYHNNHHKYGAKANFGGIKWHEIDPTYLAIRLLNWIGVIQLRRQPVPQL